MVKHATREPLHVNVRPNQVGGSFQLAGLGSGDWGQVLLVAIGKQHSPRAKPHSESRQASGKT